jgi:hypothetical protein
MRGLTHPHGCSHARSTADALAGAIAMSPCTITAVIPPTVGSSTSTPCNSITPSPTSMSKSVDRTFSSRTLARSPITLIGPSIVTPVPTTVDIAVARITRLPSRYAVPIMTDARHGSTPTPPLAGPTKSQASAPDVALNRTSAAVPSVRATAYSIVRLDPAVEDQSRRS